MWSNRVPKAGPIVLLLVLLLASVPVGGAQPSDPGARSVILMIGDGMGFAHVRLAELYARDMLNRPLALSSIRERNAMTTESMVSYITDSAASITAMMTGYKTRNTRLNVLPDGTLLPTLPEAAREAGLSIGVVSTAYITDATPAGVYAHSLERSNETEIAEQLVDFGPEVALGGGWSNFVPMGTENSQRTDERDLIQEMRDQGYTVVMTADELVAVDFAETDRLFGLFSRSSIDFEIDRVHDDESTQPSLAAMTDAALQVLDQDADGFFLLVEAGRIDHAAHLADARGVIDEVLAFDDAVQIALAYQAEHPDVLVIVTADHETGGLSLARNSGYTLDLPSLSPSICSMQEMYYRFQWMKPLEAVASCHLRLNSDDKERLLQRPADQDIAEIDDKEAGKARSWGHYVVSEAINREARINWGTWSHTAAPVPFYVVGPHADLFEGELDNTDIARHVTSLLGLTLADPVAPVETESTESPTPEPGG